MSYTLFPSADFLKKGILTKSKISDFFGLKKSGLRNPDFFNSCGRVRLREQKNGSLQIQYTVCICAQCDTHSVIIGTSHF